MWNWARAKARRAARIRRTYEYRCAAEDGCTTQSPEVNHKRPIVGRHNEAGCHHHQDGLEVLCHRHHVAVTNAQRAAGLLRREDG